MKDSPAVQSLLILTVAPMVFAFPYTAMMPLFAEELLQLGPKGLGVLLSAAAVGALVGSAWLTLSSGTEGAGKWLVGSILSMGLFLLLFVTMETFGHGVGHDVPGGVRQLDVPHDEPGRPPDSGAGPTPGPYIEHRTHGPWTDAAWSYLDRGRRRMGKRPVGRRRHGRRLRCPHADGAHRPTTDLEPMKISGGLRIWRVMTIRMRSNLGYYTKPSAP